FIPQTPLKIISNCSHITLTRIPQHNPTLPTHPQYPLLKYSPQPHPPPFPYIPESFSQCLFVIHPLRGKTLISSIFL
ncbi:hypothetical protein, partial [Klebsiella pneumoniae]|uniref:hypothetical protein n=1 Tax=Klebsiella pneumoniae TaxID=573 RepID=UPI001D0E14EC